MGFVLGAARNACSCAIETVRNLLSSLRWLWVLRIFRFSSSIGQLLIVIFENSRTTRHLLLKCLRQVLLIPSTNFQLGEKVVPDDYTLNFSKQTDLGNTVHRTTATAYIIYMNLIPYQSDFLTLFLKSTRILLSGMTLLSSQAIFGLAPSASLKSYFMRTYPNIILSSATAKNRPGLQEDILIKDGLVTEKLTKPVVHVRKRYTPT